MDALINDYLRYCLLERGLAPRTLEVYGTTLRRVAETLTRGRHALTWAEVTVDDLRGWLASTATRAAGTRRLWRTVLCRFMDWAVAEGTLPANPARRIAAPAGPKRLPVVPTEADLARLFASIELAPDWLAPRDLALLEVAYGAGIRASELVGLNVSSLDRRDETILVYGKGRKERRIPAPTRAFVAIDRYRPLREGLARLQPGVSGSALFLSATGHRLTRKAALDILQRRARDAGLAGRIYLHGLRHAFTVHTLDRGAPIEVVSEQLGHSSVTVTKVYTHVSGARLKDTLRKYHPRSAA